MAGKLTAFGAVTIPRVTHGDPMRRYIIDCEHGTTNLTLQRRPADDATVLTRLLEQHRIAIRETEKDECDCQPTQRQRERVFS